MRRMRLIRQHYRPFARYARRHRGFTWVVCQLCVLLIVVAFIFGDPWWAMLVLAGLYLVARICWLCQMIPAYRAQDRPQVYTRNDINWRL